jgi:hypothetical protein
MLKGSCHCGAVRFEVSRPPEQVTSCNCSICSKRGALVAYYKPDEFTLVTAQGQSTYRWGDRMLGMNFCGTCGCWTFNDGPDWAEDGKSIDFAKRKLGVNARLFDDFDLAAVPVRHFDGRAM